MILHPLVMLGSGLMAGLFFIFSTCVMKALEGLRPPEGITAMQSINRTIKNPLFALVFWGTPVACLLLMISTLFHWQGLPSIFLLAGGVCYLAGGLLVTLIIHVPMNNKLATLHRDAPNAANFWANYVSRWTRWNHLRTVMTLIALTLFLWYAMSIN
ncbi:DUF1772 domain-containing protein [Fodinibius roseus]|uniref:anthrone oxygenase family protein n=1 Tax=Fodinibius roseus TaxID=1194090 RepID=UPI001B8AF502|nr:anthrone oxygenase family protein [Fodinibius roseus]